MTDLAMVSNEPKAPSSFSVLEMALGANLVLRTVTSSFTVAMSCLHYLSIYFICAGMDDCIAFAFI
jgi:hypothetical protein